LYEEIICDGIRSQFAPCQKLMSVRLRFILVESLYRILTFQDLIPSQMTSIAQLINIPTINLVAFTAHHLDQ
jgi:hypothetical protein